MNPRPILLGLVLTIPLPVCAAVIYPDSATTGGGYLTTIADYDIAYLFDENVVSPADSLDGSLSNIGIAYASASPPSGGFPVTVVLDFNTAQDLTTFYIWNITHPTASGPATRGLRDFSLTFYDGPNATGTQIGAVYNASAASGPAPGAIIPSQGFDFGSTYSGVQSVEFQLLNNQSAGASSWIGLREVAFEQVPEPGSGMLALVCGALGLLRRRR